MVKFMEVIETCFATKKASIEFAATKTSTKNQVLLDLKKLLNQNTDLIISENAKDIEVAIANGRNDAFIDRLKLTHSRILNMCTGLDAIIALSDPVSEITAQYTSLDGLKVKKVRSPLGVVGIIFEARPNVTVDASALCIKSGNGVILRGSSEAISSVRVLASLIKKALILNNSPHELCGFIDSIDKNHTICMLKQDQYIDVIIPRGGDNLKKLVFSEATMPVIAAAGGNCHTYIANSADESMAIDIAINAKLSRPSVCNALETLLIDRRKSEGFIKEILSRLEKAGTEIRGTNEVNNFYKLNIVDDDEFYLEYAQPIIKVAIVSDVSDAVAHINKYGSKHSEAIITEDKIESEYFTSNVDCAAVYVNASTRFTDGFRLGLGAEMGISTQKLHVRGPIGLRELTSERYIVHGDGQICI
jgi:glutamate-5-semialdehyde dehydrogenase